MKTENLLSKTTPPRNCPKCGGRAGIVPRRVWAAHNTKSGKSLKTKYIVCCRECGYTVYGRYYLKENATRAWNESKN